MKRQAIYADFGNTDPQGRIRLNLHGTLEDIRTAGLELCEGLEVTLSDGELMACGNVEWSKPENIWVAKVAWPSVRELES